MSTSPSKELGVELPSAQVADAVLTEAEHDGYGGRDIAAFYHVLKGATANRTEWTPAVAANRKEQTQ